MPNTEEVWICEKHYWMIWPHDDCPGPGMLLSSIEGWWERIKALEGKIKETRAFVRLVRMYSPSLQAKALAEVETMLSL